MIRGLLSLAHTLTLHNIYIHQYLKLNLFVYRGVEASLNVNNTTYINLML